ncbi:MAG: 5-oxoprolinase subunit PxpB [Verrucomicrobia bacterium]|nr:5-oxoprolinase subunit PxpB [Verrucomicrobiota bacterium]
MHWIPYGPNAVLLRFADVVDEAAFHRSRAMLAELQRQPPPGLAEVTPAFTTMLLEFETAQAAEFKRQLPELLSRLEHAVKVPATPAAIEIPVRYGGPDLARVATHSKLSDEEVVRLHAASIYRVHLLGFAPGFPYLGGLDSRLHTPRLASPRPRVPAGSVAIGGEHTGIYTVDSPGGWNIIGHTDVKVFDPARGGASGDDEAMFLLKAGNRVKFIPMK